jgi:hypothetical protein
LELEVIVLKAPKGDNKEDVADGKEEDLLEEEL